jgi:flagellar motor switch protein FliG
MDLKAYKEMSKIRRLSVFLLVIGAERSAPIIKELNEKQKKGIIEEMSELGVIDESLQEMVIQEFSGFLAVSLGSLRGDKDSAVSFFENALGPDEADKVTSQIGPPKKLQEIRARFATMKASQIWSALSEEQPQTLAFILAALDPIKTAEIFSIMDNELADDIFLRMSQLEATSAKLLPRVAGNVIRAVPEETPQSTLVLGGASFSASVLKAFDRERGKELLAKILEADELLGKTISREMFSFKDLVNVSNQAMQRIMRELDSSLLMVAAKSASPELMSKIYGSLSKRGAEALKDEIEMQGNLRPAEIEAAQDAVLEIVRKLEGDGEIVIEEEEAYA